MFRVKDKSYPAGRRMLLGCVAMCVVFCLIFTVTYKSYIRKKIDAPVKCTLALLHKPNGSVHLSAELPSLSQRFRCTVPDLKTLRIRCRATEISPEAVLDIQLKNDDTGEILYGEQTPAGELLREGKYNKIKIAPEKTVKDSEQAMLSLSLTLVNAGGTDIEIVSNEKPGIVDSVNDNLYDKTNILYSMTYAKASGLSKLYFILCAALLGFLVLCYCLLIVKKVPLQRAFIPLALSLGVIFNFLIMVHGVPDEPGHIDTAYKYSNAMLRVPDTEYENTIYKRRCDAEMEDMLVNGVESNSYYQLQHHFFERPAGTDLIEVRYADTGHLVPGFVYFPAAFGISLGRLLGLSTLMTLMLGRLMNLVVYTFLAVFAIQIMPFGKNVMALAALLPISIQQAASVSYDAMIMGIILLFAAICFHIRFKGRLYLPHLILLLLMALFIAMTKGGVYLPLVLFLLMAYGKSRKKKRGSPDRVWLKWLPVICGAAVVAVIFCVKYFSLFRNLQELETADGSPHYTVGAMLRRPTKLVYLIWNTFWLVGDDHLRGLLGGKLSWLNLNPSWIFLIILLGGLLLLANVEGDRYRGTWQNKCLIIAACGGSVLLVMASMLFTYTPGWYNYISGIQGRYFLPFFPFLLLLTGNSMVTVTSGQRDKIFMVMMMTEVMIVLNALIRV